MAKLEAELVLELEKFRKSQQQAKKLMGDLRKGAKSSGKGMGGDLLGGVSRGVAGLANVVKNSVLGLGVAGAAAGGALGVGIKKALDLGGQFSDVASQIGSTAGRAQMLSAAFENNGLSVEQMTTSINRMQRALVDAVDKGGETQRAFDAIGVDASTLIDGDPIGAFEKISEAIQTLDSPTERAARAMQIFGRSGAALQVLFDDPEALKNAREQIGTQADLLDESAAQFDRASDILGGVGKKFSGFFVGVGSEIVDQILPILETVNGIDLAPIGQRLGKALSTALNAFISVFQEFSTGDMLAAVRDGLQVAFVTSVNALARGLQAAVAFYATVFTEQTANVVQLLRQVATANFWNGMLNALQGAALSFGAIISDAVAKVLQALQNVPKLGDLIGDADQIYSDQAEAFRDRAGELFAESDGFTDPLQDFARGYVDALVKGKEVAEQTFAEATGPLSAAEAQARLAEQRLRLENRILANREAAASASENSASTAAASGGGASEGETPRFVRQGSLAGAIALIQGRSANELIASEATKQTSLLEKIVENTKPKQEGVRMQPRGVEGGVFA